MSIILNIDTSVQSSSVCIAENEKPLGIVINPSTKDSASWLHVAIRELVAQHKLTLQQVDAIAVTEGPGSYTGLRVGMATAKGLCYALKKPLITINTLHLMAFAAKKNYDAGLLCPMIDARRMEVFTAVFGPDLEYVMPLTNLILNELSFTELLNVQAVVFFGNGSIKFQSIMKHPRALFGTIDADAASMTGLSSRQFAAQQFTDLAYSQPFYGKDFHSSVN